jgi:hypothetical protein
MSYQQAFKAQYRNLRRYGVLSQAGSQHLNICRAACAAFFDAKEIDNRTKNGYISDQIFATFNK